MGYQALRHLWPPHPQRFIDAGPLLLVGSALVVATDVPQVSDGQPLDTTSIDTGSAIDSDGVAK